MTTEEYLSGFDEGTITWEEIPEEVRQIILNAREGDEINIEEKSSNEEPEPEKEQQEEPKVEETKPEEVDEKVEEDSSAVTPEKEADKMKDDYAQLAYQRANEINTLKQKQQSHERKLASDPIYRKEYFEKIGLKEEKPNDYFDEEYQKKQFEEFQALKAKVEAQEESLNNYRKIEQDNAIFKGVADFQKTIPQLKTDKSIKDIDLVYNQLHSQGVSQTNEEMEKHGISSKDFDNYKILLEVQKSKASNNYPSYRSAFADTPYFESVMRRQVSSPVTSNKTEPALDPNQNQKKLDRIEKTPEIMDQTESTTSTQEGSGLTDDFINKFLADHPDPYNEGEEVRKTWIRVQQHLGMTR